ncbi:MAG: MmgE/PrpD family protein, partial [Anaerolineae bacterium]
HAGRAASGGVLAADLARRGFTGARRILEGERGFFAATSSDARPERVIQGLPCGIENSHSFQDHRRGFIPQGLTSGMQDYKITGVSIKPHASCRHTHPAIDAALALRQEHDLAPERIEQVEVETYGAALALCDNPAPGTPYAAKFSLQYCVVCALARGRAGLADFEPAALEDEAIGRLLPRVRVGLDKGLDICYPQEWPARVRVITGDGETLEALVRTPKGDPENPLTWAELEAKFRDLASGTAYAAASEAIITAVHGLDQVPGMDAFWEIIEGKARTAA